MSRKSAILLSTILLFTACAPGPRRLVIGMVPSYTPKRMVASFAPIAKYLEGELKVSVVVAVAGTYQDLVAKMGRGDADIGLYGPFSYILAEQGQNLAPLVVRDRKDLGVYYNSVIIVRSDSPFRSIEELRGRSMAFVDPASTSGFLVPDSLFISRQLDIEKFFSSYHFAGSHDKVTEEVLDRRADAGAVSKSILNSLVAAGRVRSEDLRTLWISESIPGSPFVARADLSLRMREGFKKAMLSVDVADPAALAAYDPAALRFVSAEPEMYEGIRNIVAILGKKFPQQYLLGK
jgi:phosphonate transport system substrate-binding protein